MVAFAKFKQSGTSVIEILIVFSLIGFCLIALTKSQLLVDHGYQDLMMRTKAINQAENLAEIFAANRLGLQLEQGVDQWRANSQAQLPDAKLDIVSNKLFFSVEISWPSRWSYSLPCAGGNCGNDETVVLQGWVTSNGQ